jgi:hypothetical protein
VLVEVLITKDCPHVDAAVDLVAMASRETGAAPRLMLIEISDLDQAAARFFVGSPTIRVDGSDVSPPTGGDLPSLSCRLYRTEDGLREVPQYRLVRRAFERSRRTQS